ncbi:vanadium-dependent haloperoxidase [Jannaschia sp. W003]|uniref:vanadium-dependent haloperoxidase n=1 Tax=Jannaschia sp. W003 TaxID=2867012 RepID=UPI0021A4F24D|nr:vanadium-dependent haloperoxidase [Jannaschia sp. W003]UWQ23202.1 vanadium-dependent haloperoxidase [Jannaschia sp. W003]
MLGFGFSRVPGLSDWMPFDGPPSPRSEAWWRDWRGRDETPTRSDAADGEDVRLGSGAQTFVHEGDLGRVTGGSGPQTVMLDGSAKRVSLGRGDDALIADRVDVVRMGRGDDFVWLAGAERISMGRGDDVVELGGAAHRVDLGRGDDTIIFRLGAEIDTAGGASARSVIDGGRGEDRFETDAELGAFDFDVMQNGTVMIHDRLTGATTVLRNFEHFVFDGRELTAAELRALFERDAPAIFASHGTQNVTVNDADPGINTVWNRTAVESVMETGLGSGPTVSSRVYALVHTAIYDAWAAFDPDAIRVAEDAGGDNEALRAEIEAAGLVGDEAAQGEAMSYAAHAVLRDLFPAQEALHDLVLVGRYGLVRPEAATSLAARIGMDAGADLIADRADDGSNQAGNYADTSGYAPVNAGPGAVVDITRWTPENVPVDPESALPVEQSFLTPHWGGVRGFSLEQGGPLLQLELALADPAIRAKYAGVADLDAAPEPFFTDAFSGSALDIAARTITTAAASDFGPAGTVVPVTKALIGEVVNPGFIAQAEVVLAYSASLGDPAGAPPTLNAPGGDAGKLSAEFYEDAPGTGFPPGTAMAHAEFVSARDAPGLAEDVFLFFAASNAVFDAGVATWEAKTAYDYARPIRVIRELGELGLIGEEGIDHKGDAGHVVRAYIPSIGETGLVLASEWTTYQTPGGDPSPPFAEYSSGHSAFSAAGAVVMRTFTGSDAFGGSVLVPAGSAAIEPGVTPQADFAIEWATWSDAADAAGLSRLFGGIHFEEADFHGRALGEYVGRGVYELAQSYWDGSLLA